VKEVAARTANGELIELNVEKDEREESAA